MAPESSEITELLKAWGSGDAAALDRLTPLVYDELRRLARRYMRNECAGNNTLQTTALVNEAYLRLVDTKRVAWQDRAHFFAVSATLMRRILLDRARRRSTAKRGGKPQLVDLDAALNARSDRAHELIALDDALKTLAQLDPRKAQIVELRFFGGLSVEETAEVVKVSCDTVMREWKFAKAWLLTELSRQG